MEDSSAVMVEALVVVARDQARNVADMEATLQPERARWDDAPEKGQTPCRE
jgi:hypothetical protein